MLQHVILGDLAALAFVLGLTGPVLRPVLAVPFFARLRVLGHPLVALPIWATNLIVWHLPVLYEAALRSDAVHALQHILFFSRRAHVVAVVEVLPGPGGSAPGPSSATSWPSAPSRRFSATSSSGPGTRSTSRTCARRSSGG